MYLDVAAVRALRRARQTIIIRQGVRQSHGGVEFVIYRRRNSAIYIHRHSQHDGVTPLHNPGSQENIPLENRRRRRYAIYKSHQLNGRTCGGRGIEKRRRRRHGQTQDWRCRRATKIVARVQLIEINGAKRQVGLGVCQIKIRKSIQQLSAALCLSECMRRFRFLPRAKECNSPLP